MSDPLFWLLLPDMLERLCRCCSNFPYAIKDLCRKTNCEMHTSHRIKCDEDFARECMQESQMPELTSLNAQNKKIFGTYLLGYTRFYGQAVSLSVPFVWGPKWAPPTSLGDRSGIHPLRLGPKWDPPTSLVS